LSQVWLRRIGKVVGALGVSPAAFALAVPAHAWLRGRNMSDVGVPMYERGELALLGGLGLLIVASLLALRLLARAFGDRSLLVYYVGVPWTLVWAVLFLIGASWSL
jgi:hypothetical protein